jgi:hypothetical protein
MYICCAAAAMLCCLTHEHQHFGPVTRLLQAPTATSTHGAACCGLMKSRTKGSMQHPGKAHHCHSAHKPCWPSQPQLLIAYMHGLLNGCLVTSHAWLQAMYFIVDVQVICRLNVAFQRVCCLIVCACWGRAAAATQWHTLIKNAKSRG